MKLSEAQSEYLDTIKDSDSSEFDKRHAIKNGGALVQKAAFPYIRENSNAFNYLATIVSGKTIDAVIDHYTQDINCQKFRVFYLFKNKNLTKKQFDKLLEYVTKESLTTFCNYSYGLPPEVQTKYIIKFVDTMLAVGGNEWSGVRFSRQFLMLLLILLKSFGTTNQLETSIAINRLTTVAQNLSSEFYDNSSSSGGTKIDSYYTVVYFMGLSKKYGYHFDSIHSSRLYDIK